MNQEHPTVSMGSTNIDPYFGNELKSLSKQIENETKKQFTEEEFKDSVFTGQPDKIALINLLLSTINETIDKYDYENIKDIFIDPSISRNIFKNYANKNCKKCYGQGINGFNVQPKFKERIPIPCSKCIKVTAINKNNIGE